ncbi:hypothetical protein ACFX2C_009309 [Malus domestica]
MEENKEKRRKKKNVRKMSGIDWRIAIGIGVHERFGLVGYMLGKVGIENKVGLWACDKDQGKGANVAEFLWDLRTQVLSIFA